MSGPLLMGIDVGTYSSKGVLCTPEGEILSQHQVEHGLSVPRPGWAEHDADGVWWHDLCLVSQALLDGARADAADVAALAVSALGADVVPLDARGRALRPAILYGIDTRAEAEIAQLEARYGAGEMAALAGMELSAQSVGPKILWLRQHEPDLFRQTRYLCSASSFLVYRLCGQYVLDPTTAAFFNPLFDNHHLAWSDRYAGAIAGDVPLPALAWPHEVVGEVTARAARETGLRPGTPVTAGTIDVVSEALSVGIADPGDMMIVYGTTACLLLVLDQPVPNDKMWLMPYGLPGRYSLVGGMATTGALTRWFRDHFGAREMAEQAAGGRNAYAALSAQAAQVPPGSEGLVLLPYFSGERTPLNDPQARGVMAGLSLAHGRGHLYRAILEATAYGLAHNVEVMRASGGIPACVVAAGGGTQSDLLLQIVSDVTGLEQDLPAQTIGAAYGDAFWAGLATGALSLGDLRSGPADLRSEVAGLRSRGAGPRPGGAGSRSGWVQVARHFTPDRARRALYQDYYRIYRDLYGHTREDVHALARLGTGGEARDA